MYTDRTCNCGNCNLRESHRDPCDKEDPGVEDYCCERAYEYYNKKEYGTCPYDKDINNKKTYCYCSPSERYTCSRDI